jgi:hypothetical protein
MGQILLPRFRSQGDQIQEWNGPDPQGEAARLIGGFLSTVWWQIMKRFRPRGRPTGVFGGVWLLSYDVVRDFERIRIG